MASRVVSEARRGSAGRTCLWCRNCACLDRRDRFGRAETFVLPFLASASRSDRSAEGQRPDVYQHAAGIGAATVSRIHLQRRQERRLRDLHLAELAHALLAFLLLLQ